MADKLTPKTALNRGPVERTIELDRRDPEVLDEGGGDTAATDMDANVGGAPATAGLDSGGAVGVRRGVSVGRPGFEYDEAPVGETTDDIDPLNVADLSAEEAMEPEWGDSRVRRPSAENEPESPEVYRS